MIQSGTWPEGWGVLEASIHHTSRTTTSTATELTLQNLQMLMEQTIWEQEFTQALILSPKSDYTRTLYILNQLHQLAESNPLTQAAWLYAPTSGTVFSSDLSCLPAEQVFIEGEDRDLCGGEKGVEQNQDDLQQNLRPYGVG